MFENDHEMQLYTINDVAEFFKMSPRTIYKHVRDGALKGIIVGNKYRFTRAQIYDYIKTLEKKMEPVPFEEKEPPKRY